MALTSAGIQGCCVGSNFYNLGGAHGHPTAKDQDEFNSWLCSRGVSSINIAITNYQQQKTRNYLINAGWKTEKVGSLYISTISSGDFNKLKTAHLVRMAELKKNQQEEARRKEEERQKQIQGTKFGLKIDPPTNLFMPVPKRRGIYPGVIRRVQVMTLLGPDLSMQESRVAAATRLSDYYGVNVPFWIIPHAPMLLDRYSYVYDDVRRRVYDIVKRARDRGFA